MSLASSPHNQKIALAASICRWLQYTQAATTTNTSKTGHHFRFFL
jgi:hypothetical protein